MRLRWPFMLRSTHEKIVHEWSKALRRAHDHIDHQAVRLDAAAARAAGSTPPWTTEEAAIPGLRTLREINWGTGDWYRAKP